jgi:hypothetical protein
MAAIARVLARNFSTTGLETETLKPIAMVCGAGLAVSVVLMSYGLDLSPGFFWGRGQSPGNSFGTGGFWLCVSRPDTPQTVSALLLPPELEPFPFFHGRWAKATDRQRELLQVVSALPNAGQEFTVQEVVAASQANVMRKPFTSSHVSQMLSTLAEAGLVHKNRHGKYSLAVPLLGQFIQRQTSSDVLPKPVDWKRPPTEAASKG